MSLALARARSRLLGSFVLIVAAVLAACQPSARAAEHPPTPALSATAAAVIEPTAVPTAEPTVAPAPTAGPSYAEIRPNELGKIMVLEYHWLGAQEARWTRTREHFRQDLEYLYAHGYYLTRLHDLIDNRIQAPAGKTPVVLTFDDSNRSQFQAVAGPNGEIRPDPSSAVGILESFTAQHPDFGRAAVFCVLPGADPPNDLFGQPDLRARKLQYLAQDGYELCNHTLWHATLSDYGDREISRQVALAAKAIQEAVPGYHLDIFDPPLGVYPKNLSLVLDGTFEGVSYHNRAVLEVAGGPMTAPNHRETNFLHTFRIQAIPDEVRKWFGYFEQHPEERYVSDGDPDRVVFPVSATRDYRPSPGARDVPSPDASYKVIQLR